MSNRFRIPFAFLLLAFLAATPAREAERSLQRGELAYEERDFESAVDQYTQAEEYATDPGHVACNKAAALYRLGRYREAEEHYLRSREGAAGERLANVLYNLGNAVLQQAPPTDIKKMKRAIAFYEECLQQKPRADDLESNANFNLRIARALLTQARANPNARDPDQSESGSGSPDPLDDPRQKGFQAGAGNETGFGGPTPSQRRVGERGQRPRPTMHPSPPGAGELPPIDDRDETVRLSPEDTARYLDQVVERVMREQREFRRQASPAVAKTWKDW